MNSAFCARWKLSHSQRATELRMCAWFIIHHYRAEDLASKPALITLLTGCQANKIQNKHVSRNGWNVWSHCAEKQSWKTTRQHEDGYLWISQLLHFQGNRERKRGRRLSGSKSLQLKEIFSQINRKHKTNQTQQAWTLACFSLGQPYFFFSVTSYSNNPGAQHRSSPGGVFILNFTAVIYNTEDNFTQGERERIASPPFLCLHSSAVIVGEKTSKA